MKLVLVTHRSRTSFHIADIGALVRYDERPFKLASSLGVDTEIAGKFHRAAHPFRDVAERAVAEDRRIQR